MKTKYCFARHENKAFVVILTNEDVHSFKNKYPALRDYEISYAFIRKYRITSSYLVLAPYSDRLNGYYSTEAKGIGSYVQNYEMLFSEIEAATDDKLVFSEELQYFMNNALNDESFMLPPNIDSFYFHLSDNILLTPDDNFNIFELIPTTKTSDNNCWTIKANLNDLEKEMIEYILDQLILTGVGIGQPTDTPSGSYYIPVLKTSHIQTLDDMKFFLKTQGMDIIDN